MFAYKQIQPRASHIFTDLVSYFRQALLLLGTRPDLVVTPAAGFGAAARLVEEGLAAAAGVADCDAQQLWEVPWACAADTLCV